jgi:hypothetical protein
METAIFSALFLPAKIGEVCDPEPILIGDYSTINEQIGGYFDTVRCDAVDSDGEPVVLVGYVHDEGRIRNMDINWLASMLFNQQLHGPCVLTWALDETGIMDGDGHDMPEQVSTFICENLLEQARHTLHLTKTIQMLVPLALKRGIITTAEKDELVHWVEEEDDQDGETEHASKMRERLEMIVAWGNDLARESMRQITTDMMKEALDEE